MEKKGVENQSLSESVVAEYISAYIGLRLIDDGKRPRRVCYKVHRPPRRRDPLHCPLLNLCNVSAVHVFKCEGRHPQRHVTYNIPRKIVSIYMQSSVSAIFSKLLLTRVFFTIFYSKYLLRLAKNIAVDIASVVKYYFIPFFGFNIPSRKLCVASKLKYLFIQLILYPIFTIKSITFTNKI